MTTTKNAESLTHGDHLANTSSRVDSIDVDAALGSVTIHFQHSWARPILRLIGEKVTLVG